MFVNFLLGHNKYRRRYIGHLLHYCGKIRAYNPRNRENCCDPTPCKNDFPRTMNLARRGVRIQTSSHRDGFVGTTAPAHAAARRHDGTATMADGIARLAIIANRKDPLGKAVTCWRNQRSALELYLSERWLPAHLQRSRRAPIANRGTATQKRTAYGRSGRRTARRDAFDHGPQLQNPVRRQPLQLFHLAHRPRGPRDGLLARPSSCCRSNGCGPDPVWWTVFLSGQGIPKRADFILHRREVAKRRVDSLCVVEA